MDDDGEFLRQAALARSLGSPFVARVLEAARAGLDRAPRTAALIEGWPGDRAMAAVAMRFNGALHALARRRATPALAELYRRREGDFATTIGDALAQEDAFIAAWMRDPPQTNEVGRAAGIAAALAVAHGTFGLPFELLELGSSAGLNLNLARYGYDLGGTLLGDPTSPVRIAPEWRGAAPPAGAIEIVSARGTDIRPLDIADPATAERLLAYIWSDQPDRAARLERAIALARAYPPRIDTVPAASWLCERLDEAQPAGVCRVVFHSMLLQYLDPDDRDAVRQSIQCAGARADAQKPLIWISYEWNRLRTTVHLRMTRWPNGVVQDLATCHPYAAWVDWTG